MLENSEINVWTKFHSRRIELIFDKSNTLELAICKVIQHSKLINQQIYWMWKGQDCYMIPNSH